MENLVSIIIPVYNVENYLTKCIESLLDQTYGYIEIILINDGSTDKSRIICENYASSNENVSLVNQQNQGLSAARNKGIEISKGDYILFVDSDDYIEDNTVQVLVSTAIHKKLEIVAPKGAFYHYNNEEIKIFKELNFAWGKTISGVQLMHEYINQGTYANSACLYLYSTKFINENNFRFEKGLLHEDELWTPQLLLKARRVTVLNKIFYHYVARESSITLTKPKVKNALDTLYIYEKLDHLYNNIENLTYQNQIKDMLARQYMVTSMLLKHCSDYSSEEHKQFIKNKIIVRNARKTKTIIKMALYFFAPVLYKKLNKNFK